MGSLANETGHKQQNPFTLTTRMPVIASTETNRLPEREWNVLEE
jgi:hypothetical protein